MITRRGGGGGKGEKLSTYYLIGETERGEKDDELRKERSTRVDLFEQNI